MNFVRESLKSIRKFIIPKDILEKLYKFKKPIVVPPRPNPNNI